MGQIKQLNIYNNLGHKKSTETDYAFIQPLRNQDRHQTKAIFCSELNPIQLYICILFMGPGNQV